MRLLLSVERNRYYTWTLTFYGHMRDSIPMPLYEINHNEYSSFQAVLLIRLAENFGNGLL